MRDGTVGVVVAAYRAERWLEDALCSLAAQTYASWQCVVVDDGSPDATLAVARRFAETDPRVSTVALAENRGVGAARNVGTAALGPDVAWVCYLDADDVLLPSALDELRAALADRPDAVGSYGLADYIDAAGAPLEIGAHLRRQRDRRILRGLRLVGVEATADLTFAELAVNGPLWPSAVGLQRRDVITAVGGWNESLHNRQDWELYARMSRRGPFVALDVPVASYRRHDGNATNQHSRALWSEARIRRMLWQDPANSRAARRGVARAWRYLRLREDLLLAYQCAEEIRAGKVRAAVRTARGLGLGLLLLLFPGPPSPSLVRPDLTSAAGLPPVGW